MKKFYLVLAVAALSLFAFTACNKGGGGDTPGGKEIIMKDGATKAAAKVVEFNNTLPSYKDKKGNTLQVLKMEFTEDKMCMIQSRLVATRASEGDIVNEVHPYTVNGSTHTVDGFGTVVITDESVNVMPTEGESGTYGASVTPSSTGSVDENNLARTWNVEEVLLSVSGKGVSIMAKFNGCNLEEIGAYAAENGISGLKNHLSELKGYNVDHVIFTGADSYIISFTGASAIAGTFSLPADEKLNYSFPEGNPFFHGSSNGGYDFPADKRVTITMNETVEGYSGTLEMSLTAAY